MNTKFNCHETRNMKLSTVNLCWFYSALTDVGLDYRAHGKLIELALWISKTFKVMVIIWEQEPDEKAI